MRKVSGWALMGMSALLVAMSLMLTQVSAEKRAVTHQQLACSSCKEKTEQHHKESCECKPTGSTCPKRQKTTTPMAPGSCTHSKTKECSKASGTCGKRQPVKVDE